MAVTIATGSYPNNVGFSGLNPVKVGGSGTAAQLYGGSATPIQLALPGSSRIDGVMCVVRIGGAVFPNTASNVVLTVYANYGTFSNGASQYPTASISSAAMVNNVATYNGTNTFLIGQYVSVANIANVNLNGTVGPLLTANATAFTAANVNGATLAIANIANAAQTATAAIGPIAIYTSAASPTLKVNTNAPFFGSFEVFGESKSGIVSAYGTDRTVNNNGTALVPNVSTGTIIPIPGVNLQVEPPIYLTVAHTFGVSDANNAGYLKEFVLEAV